MAKTIGIALGAGVTAALLFLVTATGSLAGLVLAYLAPLPLMIAGLGFSHLAGGLAALVGGGTVGVALGPVSGLVFVLLLGFPAWYLARLALLGRPPPAGTSVPGAPAIEWFPVALILPRVAVLAAAPVLIVGALALWRFGGYRATFSGLSSRLAATLGRDTLIGNLTVVDLVWVAPVAVAASSVLMLSLNLWLSGRIVLISDRLKRPWPDLPDAVRLPRPLAPVFGALVVAILLPGPFGLAAAVMAGALGMVFVFEGLAAAHVLTRGLAARRATLAAIYLTVVFLAPWPLFALALLGCIDCLIPLRGRAGPPSPPLPRS